MVNVQVGERLTKGEIQIVNFGNGGYNSSECPQVRKFCQYAELITCSRWRKLNGKDQSTMELIKKVQSLQVCSIAVLVYLIELLQHSMVSMRKKLAEKDVILGEKEKSVNELQTAVIRFLHACSVDCNSLFNSGIKGGQL